MSNNKNWYGKVVWAKYTANDPWWPSYIYDPLEASVHLRKGCSNGTKFLVYFYGSNNYGHIIPKNVVDFESHYEQFSQQSVSKRELTQFKLALELGCEQNKLPSELRVAWLHEPLNTETNESEFIPLNNEGKRKSKTTQDEHQVSKRKKSITSASFSVDQPPLDSPQEVEPENSDKKESLLSVKASVPLKSSSIDCKIALSQTSTTVPTDSSSTQEQEQTSNTFRFSSSETNLWLLSIVSVEDKKKFLLSLSSFLSNFWSYFTDKSSSTNPIHDFGSRPIASSEILRLLRYLVENKTLMFTLDELKESGLVPVLKNLGDLGDDSIDKTAKQLLQHWKNMFKPSTPKVDREKDKAKDKEKEISCNNQSIALVSSSLSNLSSATKSRDGGDEEQTSRMALSKKLCSTPRLSHGWDHSFDYVLPNCVERACAIKLFFGRYGDIEKAIDCEYMIFQNHSNIDINYCREINSHVYNPSH